MSNPFGFDGKSDVRPLNGGTQYRFRFDNGYGASVVQGPYTQGGDDGLWELAVLGLDGHLAYDTPITDDVIGYLEPHDVPALLEAVRALS